MNIPACSAAQGFFTPPVNANPFPSLQPWNSISEQQLTLKDSAALGTINQVAANFSSAPMSQMGQLFDLQDNFLCSFPELEHYQDRSDGQYCGPIFSNSGQAFPAWEESTGPKIFIYLSAAQKQFKSLIQQLRTSPYKVLIHPRDINWQHTNQSIDQSLYISPMPVDMSRVARHADLIICHGGFGTCTASLLAGIPLLILPQQLEQTLFGYSLAQQQLASMITDSPTPTNWINLIEQLLVNQTIKKRVSGFQAKYKGYDMQQACNCISDGVRQILKG
jgi:UDP:flavonoid glycosyltransferase YjiC (YdhE family)